jgi:sec-independent protein translocase protein TatA
MPTVLLNLEFFATSDMLLIAVVALLIFGPRKLPDIGRSIGKSLAEFKRASEDFKRTWEYEVELEHRKPAPDAATRENLTDDAAGAALPAAADFDGRATELQTEAQTVARNSLTDYNPQHEPGEGVENSAQREGDVDEINPS